MFSNNGTSNFGFDFFLSKPTKKPIFYFFLLGESAFYQKVFKK